MNKEAIYYHTLPPQNYIAESLLLGSILLKQNYFFQISETISAEVFFWECHRIIYLNIKELHIKQFTINPLNTIYLLQQKKLLERIGGVKKITLLMKQSQHFVISNNQETSLKEYIDIVYSHYISRLIIQCGQSITGLGYRNKNNTSGTEIYYKALNYLNDVMELAQPKNTDKLDQLVGDLIINITHKTKHKEISTSSLYSGFNELDNLTQGLKSGDLIVLAGRPSMGKTSLAINIANYVIRILKQGVAIFSLEMSQLQILQKMVSIASHISTSNLSSGKLTDQECATIRTTCNEIINAGLAIDDTPNVSIDYIDYKAKLIYKEKKSIRLIIIDYLQLIQTEEINYSNRTQELGYITRKLKILARNLELPILILSQLNRNIENRINKRPMLSDLRESGCVSPNTSINKKHNKSYIRDISKSIESQIEYLAGDFIHYQNQYKPLIIQNLKQYIYNCIIRNNTSLQLTHNHKLLSYLSWNKQDQINKEHTSVRCISLYPFKPNILEVMPLRIIKFTRRSYVYDVQMQEFTNFITRKIVIHNSIEQDADIVLMLYRDDYYHKNNNEPKILDVIISKHRNGPIGAFQLLFNPTSTIFTNANPTITLDIDK